MRAPPLAVLLVVGCGGDPETGGPRVDAAEPAFDAAVPGASVGEVRILDVRAADLVWPPTGGLVEAWFSRGGAFFWHEETATEGSCRLLEFRAGFCAAPCDGVCREPGVCQPWPTYESAGTLAVLGASQPVSLPPPLAGGSYVTTGGLPSPLFASGAELAVSADGAAFPAFAGQVAGPDVLAAPEPGASAVLDLPAGADFRFAWSDPEPAASIIARVTVGGNAHGQPNPFVLECRQADTGSVTFPAALLDRLGDFDFGGAKGRDRSSLSLLRYRASTVPTPAGPVDLLAGRLFVYGARRLPQ